MTDNEKRAHDLAVAIAVRVAPNRPTIREIIDGQPVECIDYMGIYFDAYSKALKKLNSIFSDSKEK